MIADFGNTGLARLAMTEFLILVWQLLWAILQNRILQHKRKMQAHDVILLE